MKAGSYSLASNKLQSILQAILILVIYPFIFVASIECTDSSILTGMATFCTTFKLCDSSRPGYCLQMGAVSCHRLSPIYWNTNQPCSLSTFFSLYVDRFLLQTTYGTVLQTSNSWSTSLKLLHDDWSTNIPFMAMVSALRPLNYR